MADDRMKNDDLQRNMGTSGEEGQDFGQQTPGRKGGGHEGGGQHTGGQKSGSQPKNEPRNMEDDEESSAVAAWVRPADRIVVARIVN